MWDQFRGNKERIVEKLNYVCRERLVWSDELENYLVEIKNKL
jgi:hypothetical protein